MSFFLSRRRSFGLTAFALLSLLAPLERADAQRRPGVSTNFYTTTGLLTLDVEAGSLHSSSPYAEAPSFMLSALVTAPLVKRTKRAWIAGVRVGALSLGNNGGCYLSPDLQSCQNRRFTERVTLNAGGAFDFRSVVLRALVGPVVYGVEDSGARVGTALHLDFAAPRLRGPTPTLFFSRSFLGRQGGDAIAISSLGASFRWVRKK